MQKSDFFTDLPQFLLEYPHSGNKDFHGAGLPFRIPLSLAERFPLKDNPVIRQFIPNDRETIIKHYESTDPLSEQLYNKVPGLVHEYSSRVLIRSTSQCAAFCRFCFRRSIQNQNTGFLSQDAVNAVSRYIRNHTEIREILVSGGDPLFGTDTWFFSLIKTLREANQDAVIRICTRIPIVMPERITNLLLCTLKMYNPVIFVIHCNHPDELDAAAKTAITNIREQGFIIVSQTVLLRTINDNSEILQKLFSKLYHIGVVPYYLFQGDLTQGTSHFRVPLSVGIALYKELRKRLSGLELPRYAVDAPQGHGKVYLPENCIRKDQNTWILAAPDGKTAYYPEES